MNGGSIRLLLPKIGIPFEHRGGLLENSTFYHNNLTVRCDARIKMNMRVGSLFIMVLLHLHRWSHFLKEAECVARVLSHQARA